MSVHERAGHAPADQVSAGSRPQVLVLRALGLGDLLTVVPCLRALHWSMPDCDIVLAAPGRLATVAVATGLVDRVLPTTARRRGVPAELSWQGPPPELAVDLHGNGPPSHLLLHRLRPHRLLAYRHAETPDIIGPEWRDDEHERERWCRLLRWYGIEADPTDLSIAAPACASPAPGAVVVHPGADAGSRRWPVERFAAVVRALRRAGEDVVVTAGAGEGALARQLARDAGLPQEAVFGGSRDVPFHELCALVAGARCVLVGDTGLAHLATALGTPSVVLFGPVAPCLWGPPPHAKHRVLWCPGAGEDPLRPGDAHASLPDARLLRITVGQVVEAVATVLERRHVPSRRGSVSARPHRPAPPPPTAAPLD
ncbi:glycosyltransferase family 9 protein [Streptomyces sp. NPDC127106]|uniref:glycosyltransferase family 9 protein n=1 Tax=Streptomyces sp. NPDC127106 TaxID=3345360 RepID=UPI003637288A